MNILKHSISILLIRDEDGKPVYDLDTIEKIENFKPRVYQETKHLLVEKETEESYIVVEEKDGIEISSEIFKKFKDDEITLNEPVYARVDHYGLSSVFYTFDNKEELTKARDAVYDHFENKFNIQMYQYKKILDTLKNNLSNDK
jgi:hypothetical protein